MQLLAKVFLCVVLASCSSTDLLKGAAKLATGASDSGISADVQMGGKRENQVAVDTAVNKKTVSLNNVQAQNVTVHDEKGGSRVDKADVVNISNNDPKWTLWLVLIGAIGWLLPTPKQCWEGLKEAFKRIREKWIAKRKVT